MHVYPDIHMHAYRDIHTYTGWGGAEKAGSRSAGQEQHSFARKPG